MSESITPDVAEPKPKRARKEKPAPPPAALTPFQTGQTVEMDRSSLHKAPYNPRTITADQRRRLKEEIERHGYLDRVVWNKTTGNIVRGHQRISILDALNGTKHYRLEVTVVEKDEAWEMAANVSGNNPLMQGEYDLPLLAELYQKKKVDPAATGFTSKELGRYYGIELSPAQQRLAELDAQIAQIEKFKADNAEIIDDVDAQDNPEFFLVVQVDEQHRALMVFESQEARRAFTDLMGLGDGRYQDARSFTLKAVSVGDDDGGWHQDNPSESGQQNSEQEDGAQGAE